MLPSNQRLYFTRVTTTKTPSHPPATPHPLTTTALAQHNANRNGTIRAEENAVRARIEAVQGAAQRMNFELPREDPWTGRRSGDGWLQDQIKTYGRYVSSQNGKKKG